MFKRSSPVAVVLFSAASLCLRPTPAAAQTTWYVDVAACPGAGTGTDADPFCKIQDGIEAAANGDTVLVLPGTYHEAIDYLDRQIVVESRDGEDVTTIDGNGLDTTVVTIAGGQGAETALDGFRITGGIVPDGEDRHLGGGVRCIGTSPSISHCTLHAPWPNLAMLNQDGNPHVSDCTFPDNEAGSIDNADSSPTIERCVFRGSKASHRAGAIGNYGASAPIIVDSLFDNCGAVESGGAIYDFGDGATIVGSTFVRNSAWEGGAIYSRAPTTIRGCMFVENDAYIQGGALYLEEYGASVSESIFLGNSSIATTSPSYGQGGAIYCEYPYGLDITNTLFVGNVATRGSALFWLDQGGPRFQNTTLVANVSSEGNGVYDADYDQTIYFHNSILWGNVPRQGLIGESEFVAHFAHCLAESGLPYGAVDEGGNLKAQPMFRHMPYDGGDGWADDPDTPEIDERDNNDYGDLRLLSGSPGIDAGDNDLAPSGAAIDLAGLPRFADDPCAADTGDGPAPIVDIGAFEFQGLDSCGNGTCDAGESCADCPCDCGDCCGDGTCGSFENCYTCAEDCACRVLNVPDDFATIQAAIDAAEPADEIVVAPGTYVENIDFLGKEITLRSSGGADVTTITAAERHGSVVTMVMGEGTGTSIRGFTITDGNGRSSCPDSDSGTCGGGIVVSDGDLTAEDCVFKLNYADRGAGLFALRSGLSVRNCDFLDNQAHTGIGAGIGLIDSHATVEDCRFERNIRLDGSGIGALRSDLTVRDSEFKDHFGRVILSDESTVLIERCGFRNNGGNNYDGGGVLVRSGECTIRNCDFVGNVSDRFGGAGVAGPANIDRCRFIDNVALWGGAVSPSWNGSLPGRSVVTNSLFLGNAASHDGGAAEFQENALVANCTFLGNSAMDGGALTLGSRVSLIGNIVRGNSATFHPQVRSGWGTHTPPSLSHNDIEGSGGSANWDESLGTDGGGNIDADPLFVDPEADDFRLSAGSPCIDAGDNRAARYRSNDLSGGPRFLDDPDTVDTGIFGWPVVDIGAYEFASESGCGNRICEHRESCHSCVFDCGPCGDTIYVPDDVASINGALAIAADATNIVVAPGTYREAVDLSGRSPRLFGAQGPNRTILDGSDWDGSTITCTNGGNPTINGFTITGGVGTLVGGDRYGGGMFLKQAAATLADCILEHNTANREGGGIYSSDADLTLTGTMFRDNHVLDQGQYEFFYFNGGGMYAERSRFRIDRCTFMRNSAIDTGGGLAAWDYSEAVVTNSLFVANRADFGAGVYTRYTKMSMANCTCNDNLGPVGNALRVYFGDARVSNSILWDGIEEDDQRALNAYGSPTTLTLSHSAWQLVDGGPPPGVVTEPYSEGNIHLEPAFVRLGSDGGDGWGDDPDTPNVDEGANDDFGDLRLTADSPCVDAGDNDAIAGFDFDLDGNPRIFNDVVDMGAYEFIPPPTEVEIVVHPRGRTDLLELHDHGHLPVAVLSSESFDALSIDPATVKLSGASVVRRGKSGQHLVQKQDVNRDGRTDLVLYFDQVDVAPDGGVVTLTGATFDGTLIVGRDTIKNANRRGG